MTDGLHRLRLVNRAQGVPSSPTRVCGHVAWSVEASWDAFGVPGTGQDGAQGIAAQVPGRVRCEVTAWPPRCPPAQDDAPRGWVPHGAGNRSGCPCHSADCGIYSSPALDIPRPSAAAPTTSQGPGAAARIPGSGTCTGAPSPCILCADPSRTGS